jgi:hypothetical protein
VIRCICGPNLLLGLGHTIDCPTYYTQEPGDEMEAAHERDYEEMGQMDSLRRQILDFIAEPPSRASQPSLLALGQAANELAACSARVVRTWD